MARRTLSPLVLALFLLPTVVLAASRTIGPGDNVTAAAQQLQPGETLTLQDGTYQGNYVNVDCKAGAKSGTAGAPITVKAAHERQAYLKGDGSARPVSIQNCSYWTVDGLRLEDGDFPNEDGGLEPGVPIVVYYSDHITLRRLLLRYNNRYRNASGMTLKTNDSLIEENELYDYHRHGFQLTGGNNNVFRRNYANSRERWDIDGGYGSANYETGKGDSGFIIYGVPSSTNTQYENNISEGNGGGFYMNCSYADCFSTKHFGNISLNDTWGFWSNGATNYFNARDTLIENGVAIGAHALGFGRNNDKNTTCRNCTALDGVAPYSSTGVGVGNLGHAPGEGPPYSFTGVNLLSVNNSSTGFGIDTGVYDWNVKSINSFGNGRNYAPDGGNYSNQQQKDAGLGSCKVWIPTTSPMKGAGEGGADIGANVLYRYKDGTLTQEALWDRSDGHFTGCGAVVAGVNDSGGNSCMNVHLRLNVNANGCGFPSGYGTQGPTVPAPTRLRVLPSK